MKRKLLILSLMLILALTGCTKNNEKKDIQVSPEQIQQEIEDVNNQLLQENLSLDDGFFIVPKSIDLADDLSTIETYVYLDNANIKVANTAYVNYEIYATDETDNHLYNYTFFVKNEDNNLEDFLYRPFLNKLETSIDAAILFEKNEIEYYSLDENTGKLMGYLPYSYEFENEVFYVYTFTIPMESVEDTYFVATFETNEKSELSPESLFTLVCDGITIGY